MTSYIDELLLQHMAADALDVACGDFCLELATQLQLRSSTSAAAPSSASAAGAWSGSTVPSSSLFTSSVTVPGSGSGSGAASGSSVLPASAANAASGSGSVSAFGQTSSLAPGTTNVATTGHSQVISSSGAAAGGSGSGSVSMDDDSSNAEQPSSRLHGQTNASLVDEDGMPLPDMSDSDDDENGRGGSRKRKNLSKQATEVLNRWFFLHLHDPYPTDEEKQRLSEETGLSLSQCNNWFGNKRMRYKRKMLEQARRTEYQEQSPPPPAQGSHTRPTSQQPQPPTQSQQPPALMQPTMQHQAQQQQQQQQQQQMLPHSHSAEVQAASMMHHHHLQQQLASHPQFAQQQSSMQMLPHSAVTQNGSGGKPTTGAPPNFQFQFPSSQMGQSSGYDVPSMVPPPPAQAAPGADYAAMAQAGMGPMMSGMGGLPNDPALLQHLQRMYLQMMHGHAMQHGQAQPPLPMPTNQSQPMFLPGQQPPSSGVPPLPQQQYRF
jgi:hypothetical protein